MNDWNRRFRFARAVYLPVLSVIAKYLLAPYLVIIAGIEIAVGFGFERGVTYAVFMLFFDCVSVWVFVRYLVPVHWGQQDRYFRIWLYEGTEKLEKELQYHEDVLKNDLINLMRLFYAKK